RQARTPGEEVPRAAHRRAAPSRAAQRRRRGLAVGLLRRRPLHRKLAEAGGLLTGLEEARYGLPGQAAEPPSWDGEARGDAGIHGVPRARRWDAVATAEAPDLRG